ncbi:MAG: hypothetical protein HYY06_17220 [Deltaproteobacteria bacterium]|nr:hypothetical protein [Deltaproteobacteria bacterium]
MQPVETENSIDVAVALTRSRLARAAGRALLTRRAGWLVAGAAVLGASRPLLWPLGDEAPLWSGIVRALGLMAAGLVVGALGLILAGRRRRPSQLGAARAIDGALGLDEVVASGHAFGTTGRAGPVVELARSRAASAIATLDVERSFPLPSLRPTRPLMWRVAVLAVLAATIGAYDPVLTEALVSPPTSTESRATSRLEEAARAVETRTESPRRQEKRASAATRSARDRGATDSKNLAKTARDAARAARRGDRSGALARLDALRRAGEDRAGRSGRLDDALRRIAEALQPASASRSAGQARPAPARTSASQELRRLAKQMQSPSSQAERESAERMLSRLSKAADAARRGSRDSAASERAAEALRRAAEALSRGDGEAAARALDEAASRAEELEEARRQAERDAERIMAMLDASGALERAIQMAMLGREGEDGSGQGAGMQMGDGEGEGGSPSAALGRAIAARLAAMGVTSGAPGTGDGGHVPDRGRSRRRGLEPQGLLHARSQVREGQRAVLAIQGLGRGGEPTRAFREVFPAYDAVAEEGIQDESIPAARRAVVQRYFQGIRPGH